MMTSNKPYFIRAIYDWIVDNELTPYLLVDATHPEAEVPQGFVNDGKILLNISPKACRGLHLDNDKIIFTARFSWQTSQIFLSPDSVISIYAKENGRGMEFGPEYDSPAPPVALAKTSASKASKSKPILTLVKQNDNSDES